MNHHARRLRSGKRRFNTLYSHAGHHGPAPFHVICRICGLSVPRHGSHPKCEEQAQALAVTPGDRKQRRADP